MCAKIYDWAHPFPEFPVASSRQVWLNWRERERKKKVVTIIVTTCIIYCEQQQKGNKINITSSLLYFDLPSYMHHDQYLYGDIMVEIFFFSIPVRTFVAKFKTKF